jgi:WD repeat-containing protein 19
MSKTKKLIFSFDQKALGKGEVIYCWQPGNKILAFCGENRIISVVDKMGQKIKEFTLKSTKKCKYMEFDNIDGDTLAVYQESCSQVTIINIFTGKKLELEIDRSNKDLPTCLRWAKTSTNLFIGTKNGMLYFYNKKNDKLNPITMSHSAQITTADWSETGNLCTGDVKKKISVTTTKGDSLLQNTELNYEPKNIKWARQKKSDNSKDNNVISIIQDNKTILIYDMNQKSKPIELALDKEYGNIVTYEWFGDGYIAIGFSKGYVSIVSSHMDEVKNEINSKQLFKNDLNDISVCDEVNRIAVAGENCIKIIDKNSFEEITNEKIDVPKNAGSISKISWSKNGQILLVSTFGGNFYAFNVVINETFAVYGNLFATLLSINEVAAYMLDEGKKKFLYNIQLSDEPETFEISDNYLVASLGSKVEIFLTTDENNVVLKSIKGVTKDFYSQISMIALNDNYLTVLCEGKAHLIDLKKDNTIKIFPLKDTEDIIHFICMTYGIFNI